MSVYITALNRCTWRYFTDATQHNDLGCDLIIWKGDLCRGSGDKVSIYMFTCCLIVLSQKLVVDFLESESEQLTFDICQTDNS